MKGLSLKKLCPVVLNISHHFFRLIFIIDFQRLDDEKVLTGAHRGAPLR
jgi:hypothetical protein